MAKSAKKTANGDGKKRRGFASMDPELVSELGRKGGQNAHKAGTAHQFTPEEASAAGKLGGARTHKSPRARKSKPRVETEAEAVEGKTAS